jgi:hypothetical protein
MLDIILKLSIISSSSETLLTKTSLEKLDSMLNNLKARALSITNAILNYITCYTLPAPMQQSPFFSMALQFAPVILMSLFNACSTNYSSLSLLMENDTANELLVEMLKMLVLLSDNNNFYGVFAQNKQRILVDIILVLMRTQEEERQSMFDNPESFVALALDTCEKQDNAICKTEAAKLLESICDHIDGALTFVSVFVCEAMAYALKGRNPDTLCHYLSLQPFASSPFLAQTQIEVIVDTAIVAMTDISYLTPRRKDIL